MQLYVIPESGGDRSQCWADGEFLLITAKSQCWFSIQNEHRAVFDIFFSTDTHIWQVYLICKCNEVNGFVGHLNHIRENQPDQFITLCSPDIKTTLSRCWVRASISTLEDRGDDWQRASETPALDAVKLHKFSDRRQTDWGQQLFTGQSVLQENILHDFEYLL